jgi:hypothetical protein
VTALSQKPVDFTIIGILSALIFSVKVTAESSAGFPPSPGFPESSAAKELLGLDDVLSCSVQFFHVLFAIWLSQATFRTSIGYIG